MKIERFVAGDTRSAMAQVRSALGPDALILANRRRGGLVEITASRYCDAQLNESGEESVPGAPESDSAPENAAGAGEKVPNEIQFKSLQRELEQLRGILHRELGSHLWTDTAQRLSPAAAVMKKLQQLGLSRSLAGAIADRAAAGDSPTVAWRRALAELEGRLVTVDERLQDARRTVALFGGTGVGKTSTLAKLAALDLQRYGREQVAILNMDLYRIGAREQLEGFAGAVGVACETVHDSAALLAALKRYGSLRRVYIDTAGMGQRDTRLYDQHTLLRSLVPSATCQLVVSAASQPCQSRGILEGFGSGAFAGAIITKTDEATRLGGVIDVLLRGQVPLAYTCGGQCIPEDIRPASARELIGLAVELLPGDAREASAPGSRVRESGARPRAVPAA